MNGALPASVLAAVEAALSARAGRPVRVTGVRRVGGGCINPSARVDTDAGLIAFVKWNPDAPPGFFSAEAEGLAALRDAGVLRIPEVWGLGEGGGAPVPWLLLEYVEPGRPAPDFAERLGAGLAELHRRRSTLWGWPADNYIGSLPQPNGWLDRWAAFWRERRLEPQLRRARDAGFFAGTDARAWHRVLDRMDKLLEGAEHDGPSLLHGDLWSGNVYADAHGAPVLVDPAVYHGHREVDLAMTELFGGFPSRFYDAYREAWPLDPAYSAVRRDAYQLYPLLVHVVLFGAAYTGGTMARVTRLAALGSGRSSAARPPGASPP